MKKLIMKIKNIKCIDELTFEFPLKSGLYAITGENGAGKTTLYRVHRRFSFICQ